MADLITQLHGDEAARKNLLDFVRHLDQESKGAKISPLLRSVRGRIENALPAIERMAYSKGWAAGHEAGAQQGYQHGYDAGRDAGYEDSQEDRKLAYDEGHEAGYKACAEARATDAS
jgi:hypothetical protein